ncbi:MAG TPA: cytochrome c peroxidase [Burkholderiaceae bacterium]|nr:cytochrome c peroxidase [Burkholderiaceae bacterium]
MNSFAREARSGEPVRWTGEEMAILGSMTLRALPPAPADESNAVADLPAAAALGKRLFNDARFSRDGKVSCAGCHLEDKQFQDGIPLARGVATGTRRTMPIVGAAYSPWLFWDGRKDSLWAQALGPLEDPAEHGGNRTRIAHLMQAHYRTAYEPVFGTMPDLSTLPNDAGPGGTPGEQSAWNQLDRTAQQTVNRIYSNVGKAIAAYERTLGLRESRFDAYVSGVLKRDDGGRATLTSQEINGLRLFIGKGQCSTCHNGPLLTDQHFHNTGVPQRNPQAPDHGRAAAIEKVQRDEFNCMGPFSDAGPGRCEELRFIVASQPALDGAFKTPSLRNVALRAPYMHAGQLATLEEVVRHYAKSPPAAVGQSELAHAASHRDRKRIQLSESDIQDLVAFLGTLSSPIAEAGLP